MSLVGVSGREAKANSRFFFLLHRSATQITNFVSSYVFQNENMHARHLKRYLEWKIFLLFPTHRDVKIIPKNGTTQKQSK